MERREYFFNEMPDELGDEIDEVRFWLGISSIPSVGFTLDGVRYRIYRDEKAKEVGKPLADLMDALRGADVSEVEIRAGLDYWQKLRPKNREAILTDVARAQRRTMGALDIERAHELATKQTDSRDVDLEAPFDGSEEL